MKSLRLQLTTGLLLSFWLLLGAGDALTYFSIRGTLARQFDDALLARAVTIASSVKSDRGDVESHFSERIENGFSAAKEIGFYQLWEIDGEEIINHSSALGENEMPKEFSDSSTPRFFDLKLPDGTGARGVGFCFTPAKENETHSKEAKGYGNANIEPESKDDVPQLGVVVAASRERLAHTLNFVIWTIVCADLLTLLMAMLMVNLVLRRGLQPLDRLADQARQIGAGSLNARFPAEGVPKELMPITARLNDLLLRLEASFGEMSKYASKVTHELRTPLAILRLKVEQGGGKIAPEIAEELQAEIQQLGHVIEQSLFIAKADQGRLKLNPRQFNLADVVADVVEDFSLLAEEQQRRVLFKKTSGTLPVSADLESTRQIVHNLLSNALKHGNGDIHVNLIARRRCALTILNRTRANSFPVETLGLGLRVVDSLLQLQPDIKLRRRQGSRYHATQMSFSIA